MSQRVTRSSARLAAAETASTSSENTLAPPAFPRSPPKPTSSRKRKAPLTEPPSTNETSIQRRTKKVKVSDPDPSQVRPRIPARPKKDPATADSQPAAMSTGHDEGETTRRTSSSRRRQASPPGTSAETSLSAVPAAGHSRRKSSRKSGASSSNKSTSTGSSSKRAWKSQQKKDLSSSESTAPPVEDDEEEGVPHEQDDGDKDGSDERSEEDAGAQQDDQMDEDDPFTSNLLGRMAGSSSISNTLRALSDMMSGLTGRLRGILENLRMKDDPSVQLIALTDLSELLLISNEDNLAGAFSPDQFVKELVTLMQPNDYGEENPEMMLLACRCIANLMEAIPSSTSSVVYGGAVPILCQKLLEIHYIDLAEQALSTLEKISVDFPSSIVREGGLTACLTYLDFFPTSTQRTAVTTAANCCRGIPEESFSVIKDVMPILLNVLSSNDQRVVEQGSLCVCRIIESFRWQHDKLEELINADLLKAILHLLLPGSTNLIGANIHTHFLRVLAIAVRASPRICVQLLRLHVVDTLYQILTGVSPPAGTEDVALKIDKNIIMQALIRSSKDQIFETLNLINEILPAVSDDGLTFAHELGEAGLGGMDLTIVSTRAKASPKEKREKLLAECPEDVRRFTVVLFPTLMHAYSSTVNLNVRQKVLGAHLKMLSNFDVDVLQSALHGLPFASHIASILTQQENPLLVTFALQIAEMLIMRLGDIYRSSFYREGVIAEIMTLAGRPLSSDKVNVDIDSKSSKATETIDEADKKSIESSSSASATALKEEPSEMDLVEDHMSEDEGAEDEPDVEEDENQSGSDSTDSELAHGQAGRYPDVRDIITLRAQKFMQSIATMTDKEDAKEATETASHLRTLGERLETVYRNEESATGRALFQDLAEYFASYDARSITSYELLKSDIVVALLNVLTKLEDPKAASEARSAFLGAFRIPITGAQPSDAASESAGTRFSVLLHKLQDLLSRTEHFEVITVHQNGFDNGRSSATSMLAKQLRLKLSADEESGIPQPYRNIMVSIHAIATFRALDDYLRPRISLADIPDTRRIRKSLLEAAMARSGEPAESKSSKSSKSTPSTVTDKQTRSKSRHSNSGSSTESTTSKVALQSKRSTRKQADAASSGAKTPVRSTPATAGETDSPLECADETKISDDDGTEAALDSVVDQLEEELADAEEDPSAVNMEVANSGKVTARKDDGTRVATPLQGSHGSTSSTLQNAALSTPTATPRRGMSYASAVQSTPKDWHIEFSVNGQPIANDTTIYRAVHFSQAQPVEPSGRVAWSATHKISFRRVPGPPSSVPTAASPEPSAVSSDDLPVSLSQHPNSAAILQLMSVLHELNNGIDDVSLTSSPGTGGSREPLTRFINTKLTAKLNRQLEEPLIVASNCLPSWAEDLARLYPFLFPFESRHLFLQSTSFGYSRSMARWQNGQTETQSRRHRDERPFLGRTQRQKVRISRNRILESALKVMELYGSSPSILEVEYFEEVGTGLGPTLEFYATISQEFSKRKLKLWREHDTSGKAEFAFGANGLFPAPMSAEQAENDNGKRVLHLFRLLGKFVARSMLDSRIIDISFNPTFFRICNGADLSRSLGAVATVDRGLAQSLQVLMEFIDAKALIDQDTALNEEEKAVRRAAIRVNDASLEDLSLDFTLPGYAIELQSNGASVDVTIDNVEDYVQRVLENTLGSGVAKQIEAFRAGFSQVFPHTALRAFTADELVMLFGQVEEDWSLETLMDSIKADHGFNLDSASVRNLLQTISSYSPTEKRDFLQFVTGSPKLPIGGFKSLTPMFTVVCKPSEPPLTPDDYLPSVMTCVNYLKMPNYTNAKVLQAKLALAIKEGQGAFHLS